MLRRTFIGALAGVVAAPALPGRAQQAKPAVIGVLSPHFRDPTFAGFFERLRELGYQEGTNLTLLRRSADAQLERLPELAAELVRAKVDVIVAIYTPGSRAAIDATKTIPVVIGMVGDPVGTGLVTALARPGGNVTGVSNMSGDLASKRLEILKEAAPSARRIGVVFNPEDRSRTPRRWSRRKRHRSSASRFGCGRCRATRRSRRRSRSSYRGVPAV